MKTRGLTSLALAFFAVSIAHAQTTAPVAPAAVTPASANIHQRKVNQQDRIAQGLKSGQLTSSEAATLETQESGINKEEAGMRQQDNGHLTQQDKATLKTQQNVESKDIYADKHNSAVQRPTNGEVNDRLRNQQERIGKGVKQGDLTATQTAKLETQETGINKEETGMREQDNGKLTAADKKTLNKQLTQERRRISRDERHTERRK